LSIQTDVFGVEVEHRAVRAVEERVSAIRASCLDRELVDDRKVIQEGRFRGMHVVVWSFGGSW
jgi:hypothetical protein